MNKFEYGTRVHHDAYGYGKALNSYNSAKLVQVLFDTDTGYEKRFGRLVHPVSLTEVPAPRFTVTVQHLNGTVEKSEEMDNADMREYTRQIEPTDIISYTVRRVLSSDEAVAFYFAGYGDEGNVVE